MNNRISYISKQEAELIRLKAVQDKTVYFVEIEGNSIKTEEEYVAAIASAFAFPHSLPALKLGWCNDYINDLLWIKQPNIVMLIHDFEKLLSNDLKIKKEIVYDFEEIILPWWEHDVIGHMVGGFPRGFLIYLEI